jgi:hypothetical protein
VAQQSSFAVSLGATGEPKRRCEKFATKPALAKVETRPRQAAGRDQSLEKMQTKGKGGAKGKQAKEAKQESKDLASENRDLKLRRGQHPKKQERSQV